MGIALAEAERMNLCLPGLALAKQLYEAVRAQGYGRKGTHALMLALEQHQQREAVKPDLGGDEHVERGGASWQDRVCVR